MQNVPVLFDQSRIYVLVNAEFQNVYRYEQLMKNVGVSSFNQSKPSD